MNTPTAEDAMAACALIDTWMRLMGSGESAVRLDLLNDEIDAAEQIARAWLQQFDGSEQG